MQLAHAKQRNTKMPTFIHTKACKKFSTKLRPVHWTMNISHITDWQYYITSCQFIAYCRLCQSIIMCIMSTLISRLGTSKWVFHPTRHIAGHLGDEFLRQTNALIVSSAPSLLCYLGTWCSSPIQRSWASSQQTLGVTNGRLHLFLTCRYLPSRSQSSFTNPRGLEGWVAAYMPRWFMVTHPSTSRSTLLMALIETNVLTNHHETPPTCTDSDNQNRVDAPKTPNIWHKKLPQRNIQNWK